MPRRPAQGTRSAHALESAIVLHLPAGAYTAVVRGANGATGQCLSRGLRPRLVPLELADLFLTLDIYLWHTKDLMNRISGTFTVMLAYDNGAVSRRQELFLGMLTPPITPIKRAREWRNGFFYS